MSYFQSNNVSPDQRIFRTKLPKGDSAFINTSGTAYWIFVGRTNRDLVIKFVEFNVNVIGVGAQTAEIGLFSTPSPPNKTNQSLTKLVATGTVDSLTTTGMKRNTAAFATVIPAYTNLWAGLRIAMATTQCDITSMGRDLSEGAILTLAASGVLTGAGPFAGVIPANTSVQGPDLRATLD
jgi:hypothetical protein